METQAKPQIIKSQLAEVKARYKVNPHVKPVKITNSKNVSDLFRTLYPVQIEYREAMMVLFLNRANITTGYAVISIGGVAGTICDPKIVFQLALLCHASGLILCHNHPSGMLKPSHIDIKLTKKIKSAAELLDITLLDHVILTEESYYSFADEAIL